MNKVILDTNFLVYCAEQKIDYKELIDELINEGHELVVPEQVVSELRTINEKSEKLTDRNAAKLALKLIEHNKVNVLKARGQYADEAVLFLAPGNIVATHDVRLKNKLRNSRRIVITGNKKLVFE